MQFAIVLQSIPEPVWLSTHESGHEGAYSRFDGSETGVRQRAWFFSDGARDLGFAGDAGAGRVAAGRKDPRGPSVGAAEDLAHPAASGSGTAGERGLSRSSSQARLSRAEFLGGRHLRFHRTARP